jgi:hydrogenase maturation protease
VTRRIICVGNRYVPEDAAGPQVYERLRGRALPPGVELVDGGLGGLDLLSLVEDAEQVVFVDAIAGDAPDGTVVVLDADEAAATAGPRYDHAAGLAYLLRALPAVCAGRVPRVQVVGLAGPNGVDRAAALALQLVEDER